MRIQVPLGMTSAFDFVFAPETTLDESRAGFRAIWNMMNTEFTISGIHNALESISQNIAGFGIKTDLVLGLWFEGAFFDEKPLPGENGRDNDYFRWLAALTTRIQFLIKNFFCPANTPMTKAGRRIRKDMTMHSHARGTAPSSQRIMYTHQHN